MKRIRVVAHGTVQGVGFRFATKAEADRIGVTGWVRNVGSNRVEAEVQGNGRQVDELWEWLQHGPSYAAVERVEAADLATDEHEAEFRLIPSK